MNLPGSSPVAHRSNADISDGADHQPSIPTILKWTTTHF
jgi:hypothetical protein